LTISPENGVDEMKPKKKKQVGEGTFLVAQVM
jgi:hypothetical protein